MRVASAISMMATPPASFGNRTGSATRAMCCTLARRRSSGKWIRYSRPVARRRPSMSRAYRIRVRESLTRIVRAQDQVSTQLELLEVLPREEMADMLARELESRGFRREGQTVIRSGRGVTVEVEL